MKGNNTMETVMRRPSIEFTDLMACKRYNNEIIPYLVEVSLPKPIRDSYLTTKETLRRVGIVSSAKRTLYQTCHILSKRGKFYICHFKFLFALDGRLTDISINDIKRQNKIIDLLTQWGLVAVVDPTQIVDKCDIGSVKIIKYSDKDSWELKSKYVFKSEKNK